MGELLKTFFSRRLVRRLATDIRRVYPAFPARAFVTRASDGLEELELVDRARHIAASLAAYLPAAYPDALDVLIGTLGPPVGDAGRVAGRASRTCGGVARRVEG